MARLLSPVWSQIRGSIAGTTYLANQFHQIIARARTSPVNPNTTFQSLIRSAMGEANDAWNNMTQAQRNGWELYGQGTQWPGPLGSYTIPGRQCFIAGRSMQTYISDRGLATPNFDTTPPFVLDGFYDLKNVKTSTFTTPSDTGVACTFSAEQLVDCCWMVEISPGFNPARLRYKGPWDTANSQGALLVKNTSIIVQFGGLVADAAYFMRVRAVADDAPPRVCPQYILRAIAVTNGP